MGVSTRSLLTYVGIGIAAGVFSALFGVGGGGIVVPLLILLARFGSKSATGTSLAAIGLTALAGTVSFTTLGEVQWGYAALVGVPALVLVAGLAQLEAQATSLAAIIPVVAAGAWRQHRYGNVRWRPALVIGLASMVGVAGGVAFAVAVGENTLRRLFAVVLILIAARVAWTARSPERTTLTA